MVSGVPVITSNTSSLPEVAEDAALLVNPTKVFEIYEAMEALATNGALRADFKERGLKQSKKFTWGKAALETLEIYRKVFGMGDMKKADRR
jgi:glycosyltransferase involved in cell wall biosynthesis